MSELIELAIIGAGPAGLAAAAEAAEIGVPVTLIDSFSRLGGQYFKQTPAELGGTPNAHARPLFERAARDDVRVITGTAVWGIFPEETGYLLCLYGRPGTPRRLHTKQLILAPGAHDRPAPFPGWTLPGVLTAGAALTLVKHQRLLPGKRILLSGSGPLQLVWSSTCWRLAQRSSRSSRPIPSRGTAGVTSARLGANGNA